jgi:hypothetical protein
MTPAAVATGIAKIFDTSITFCKVSFFICYSFYSATQDNVGTPLAIVKRNR